MGGYTIFNFDELTTPLYQLTLLDDEGAVITDVDSLVLTFYDRESGDAINSRNEQDALNANDVVFSGGVISWRLQLDDTIVIDAGNEHELRIALWEWTYSPAGETLSGKHVARMRVRNLEKVS